MLGRRLMSLWRRRREILGSLGVSMARLQTSWNSSPDLDSPYPLRDIKTPLSRFHQGTVDWPDQSKIKATCTKSNERPLLAIGERSHHSPGTDRSMVAFPRD
jgi:hypothetical protein